MKLSDFKAMQERCSNCSFCKWIPFDKVVNARFAENCPSIGYYNFNTYSARGRFQLGLAIVNGEQPVTDGLIHTAHSCLACGSCDASCKICRYNLEPLQHNIALKAEIVKGGGILPEQKKMIDSLKAEKTMIPNCKKANRSAWLKDLKVKNVFEQPCEALFFAGCKYSFDTKLMDSARETLKLLVDCGADIGVMGDAECCCAGRAWQQGLLDEYADRAKANIALIRKSNAKVIVTPCADCLYSFRRLYAELGLDIRVLHVTEYIDELIKEEKIKFTKTLNLSVTYHDPCHLGRMGEPYTPWKGEEKKILNQIHTWEPRRPRYNGAYGVYDAPRRIINAIPGVNLVEMTRIREYSWCCGAGGGCGETDNDFASWTAGERMSEAACTGADVLVTSCPWCKSTLGNATGEDGTALGILDITELVRKAL